jgi:hypothetical protein
MFQNFKADRLTALFLTVLCVSVFGAASAVFSQSADPVAAAAEQAAQNTPPVVEGAENAGAVPADPNIAAIVAAQALVPVPPDVVVTPEMMSSVLFNKNEHELIKEARRSIGIVRPTTEAEIQQDFQDQQEEKVKPPPEERYIRLGGIVFADTKNWTIWLNEKRVTPQALPPEVLDLRVFDGFIEVKWFDDYSNQIFPIRLRPHQRFNIDTRIFLPG